MKLLYIGVFGLLGVLTRYAIGFFVAKFFTTPFPHATFWINVLGSFLIGVAYVIGMERDFISPDLRHGLIIGFLGGFTTFSSYSLEAVRLMERAEYFMASLYFVGSPILGFLSTLAALILTRRLTS